MHLENPVEHGDIDTNYDYLSKTKQSLENLQQLYQTKTKTQHKDTDNFLCHGRRWSG
jgi:hypothetical protein